MHQPLCNDKRGIELHVGVRIPCSAHEVVVCGIFILALAFYIIIQVATSGIFLYGMHHEVVEDHTSILAFQQLVQTFIIMLLLRSCHGVDRSPILTKNTLVFFWITQLYFLYLKVVECFVKESIKVPLFLQE
jgi:hypothetical protein